MPLLGSAARRVATIEVSPHRPQNKSHDGDRPRNRYAGAEVGDQERRPQSSGKKSQQERQNCKAKCGKDFGKRHGVTNAISPDQPSITLSGDSIPAETQKEKNAPRKFLLNF